MNIITKIAAISPLLVACSNIEGEWYTTNLDTTSFEFFIEYDTSYFLYYNDMPRDIEFAAAASDLEGELAFYEMFLSDENDRDVIEQVVQCIEKTTQDPKEQIQLAVTLVQNEIQYDHDKLKDVGNWNVYYPMETLIWKKGVCSDKSLLLGKILVYMNYNICFFLFNENNHMALGIKSGTEGFASSGYEYIETTSAFEIGAIPLEAPEQKLTLSSEVPNIIIPKYNGQKIFKEFKDLQREYLYQEKKFGVGYSTAAVERKIQILDLTNKRDVISALEILYEALYIDYQAGNLTYDSILTVQTRMNEKIKEYNRALQDLH
jgi:hypothetical protein